MPFITVILKGGQVMNKRIISNGKGIPSPFWVIVNKEIADTVRSWRFIILISIMILTCLGSLYTAFSNFSSAVGVNNPEGSFFFLKLFTISDGTLPSFIVFISFLGPLLGISLGFDSINSEHNKGTLSRVLSQPIYRDYLLNAKFVSAIIVLTQLDFVKSATLVCQSAYLF